MVRPQYPAQAAAQFQDLVDNVADRTHQPVVLEDRELRLLAHSVHREPLDSVRADSILLREASSETRAYLLPLVRHSQRPLRVAASKPLSLSSRLCIPAVCNGAVVGYLWFVEGVAKIDEATAKWCTDELAGIAATLAHSGPEKLGPGRRRVLCKQLLESPEHADKAGLELEQAGTFVRHTTLVVACIRPTPCSTAGTAGWESAISDAAGYDSSGLRRNQVIWATERGVTTVLISVHEVRQGRNALARMHTALQEGMGPDLDVVIGTARERGAYTDLAAAATEASLSARAAEVFSALGPIVRHDDLAPYEPFLRLASPAEDRELHPAIGILHDHPDASMLLETLECYLDTGCNVLRASQLLTLHRSSLYYRIRRVEEIAGLDLRDGVQRTGVHLAIKAARLSGLLACETTEP